MLAAHAGVKLRPASGPLKEQGAALTADIRVDLPGGGGQQQVTQLGVNTKVYFCQDEDVCLFKELVFAVPVGEAASGSSGEGSIELAYGLSPQAQTGGLPF